MRKIIMSKDEGYDITRHKDKIDEIVEKFADYLETYRAPRGGTGLTTQLGPAGKVLNKFKSEPAITFTSLVGYGARAHEMSTNYIDHATLELLKDAVQALFDFIPGVPLSARDKAFEMIHYGLYFKVKKKSLTGRAKYLTALADAYHSFLRDKFESIEQFNSLAKTSYDSFSEVSLPTQSRMAKMGESEKHIASQFINSWSYSESES